MYAIREKWETVGSILSRDNGRLWHSGIRPGTTPASDEAAEYETRAEAEAVMVSEGYGDRWEIVEVV